jgi:hypothetical protein
MAYKIKAEYSTGDSFGSRDETRVLEMSWESLENAKAALNRIEEHYRWYDDQHSWDRGSNKVPQPVWHQEGHIYEGSVEVILDNGNPVTFQAPWCGYFERLYGAGIIQDLPSFSV